MHDDAIEILQAYLIGQKAISEVINEKEGINSVFIDENRTKRIQMTINFLQDSQAFGKVKKGVPRWLN